MSIDSFKILSNNSRLFKKAIGPMIPSKYEYFGSETHDEELKTIISRHEDPVKLIAKFQGDWLDDLDTAVSVATQEEYTSDEFHPDYLYTAELTKFPGKMPNFEKMVKLLGFTKTASCNIQMQRPGGVIRKHVDPTEIFQQPNGTVNRRVMIMLAPGEYGQIVGFTNRIITHWEAGTVVYVDYPSTWHFTANAGWHTRPILLVTGEVDSNFYNLLDQKEPTIFQL
jgi:hypothetical protein